MTAVKRKLPRLWHLARLGLSRLEARLAPAAVNALISRADPSMFSQTSGAKTEPETKTISADGRFVVFSSSSGQVVSGQIDNNADDDVFLYDRNSNTTELISHAYSSNVTASNGASNQATISADGRYVVFISSGTNLIAGMTVPFPNTDNIFLFDTVTKTTNLVTHQYDSPNMGQTFGALDLRISANGQTVVFSSESVNLVIGVPPQYAGAPRSKVIHAYAYDTPSSKVSLIDHKFGVASSPGSQGAYVNGISADGRFAVIASSSNDLTASIIEKNVSNIFRYDCLTGENLLITKSAITGKIGGNDHSDYPSISADGKSIAFVSEATNLITNFAGPQGQVYVTDAESGKVNVVSHVPGIPSLGANDGFYNTSPIISANGQLIAYQSRATDLIDGFVNANGSDFFNYDVFLYDRLTDSNVLVSHKAASNITTGNTGGAGLEALSDDGRIVIFSGFSTDLVEGFIDNTGSTNGSLFAFDRLTGINKLISHRFDQPNVTGNAYCQIGDVTADGMTVVFTTPASDIMSGLVDANGADDVYIRDIVTDNTVLASRRFGDPSLSPGGDSTWVQQSADGRYVVYTSLATNIVAGQIDLPNTQDVFLFDRQTNSTILVSHAFGAAATTANAGVPVETGSAIPVISADGRYVAYTSYATNLIDGFVDGNGSGVPGSVLYTGVDVYLFDRITGLNTLVSNKAGTPNSGGDGTSGTFNPYGDYLIAINGDGRYVVYYSTAGDLVDGFIDNNGTSTGNVNADVYVFDRTTGLNTLVSHAAGSPVGSGNDGSYAPSINGDGRFITYWSYSYTLVNGMAAAHARNIFVYDQQTGQNTLVSHTQSSVTLGSNGWSTSPVISQDGNYVVYMSLATNLVTGQFDSNNQKDTFVYNRQTGVNTLVTHAYNSPTVTGNAYSIISSPQYGNSAQMISNDGRFLVYSSGATNLISGFAQGYPTDPSDVYLFDRITGTNVLVSRTATSATTSANRKSYFPTLSGDGRFVSFISESTNIVTGFSPPTPSSLTNVYVFDRMVGTNKLASHSLTAANISGNDSSYAQVISTDGSVISYQSAADNLVVGDYNSFGDVFAYITPPPRVQSVQLNDGSPQRSVIRSMTINFDDAVFLTGIPFSVVRGQGEQVGSVQCAVGSENKSVTLTFSGANTDFGSLADGNYTLTVIASGVSGIGNLDGNGDGVGGDDYVFTFHRLFGDGNGDKRVDSADFALFRQAFGIPGIFFDFNNDGQTNSTDFVEFRKRFGLMI